MKRTRIIAVLLTVVMLLAVMPFSAVSAAGKVWDGTVASSFASGNGTEDDPYIITNGAELAHLYEIDSTGLYFELGNDIVLNDTSAANWYENAMNWGHIEFYGNFDGKGYTISGLCYNPDEITEDEKYIGLFGYAENAIIENVNVEDAYLVGTYSIGGIAGEGNCVYISNCSFDGTIKAYKYEWVDSEGNSTMNYGSYAAGIIGYVYGEEEYESYIGNCVNNGDVYTESYNAAGIAGGIEDYCYVEYCQNYGNICGSSYSGGIVGEAWGEYWIDDEEEYTEYEIAEVSYCENYGDVSGHGEESYYIGGIAGYIYTCMMTYCRNFGDIEASYEVGGVIGKASARNEIGYLVNYGAVCGSYKVGGIVGNQKGEYYTYPSGNENIMFTEAYALVNHGNVEGIDEGSYYIGGIVGEIFFGDFNECWNYGAVSGYITIGGIVGNVSDAAYLILCYNAGDVEAIDSAGGIAGEIYEDYYPTEIYGCTNKGYIYAGFDAGGIVGYGSDHCDIEECQNKGTIEGICCVGGIAGYIDGGYVANCLNDGEIIIDEDVSGEYEAAYGGGICGETDYTEFTNCISVGTVDNRSADFYGGLVGDIFSEITITNCYYLDTTADFGVGASWFDADIVPYTEEYKGTNAVSASEMKKDATFADFDFENVWTMGEEHPELMYAVASILGDVDFDGEVGKMDYSMVKRYCFETAELDFMELIAADVNGDGVIDKMDYSLIKRSCFGTAEIK